MERKITISLSDEVYDGLTRQVDAEHMSDYIENLLRSIVAHEDELLAAYREMASDTAREQEALDWIESAPDDALE